MWIVLAGVAGAAEPVPSFLAAESPALASLEAPVGGKVVPVTDWFALAPKAQAGASESPAVQQPVDTKVTQTAEQSAFVPWPQRRGPAYPGDFWHSFGRDAKEMPATLWDDTKATVVQPFSWVCFGLAGAAGIALHGNNGDDHVAHHFTENGSQLNTFWDSVGDAGGSPATHFAVAGAGYLISLARGDTKTYEVSKTMLNALAINGLGTLALEAAARTESPNGDEYGWPSGHTSSSFCFAAVMHRAYGPWVGVPLYGFASFVGYERIDARNHDLSDVISGALIGLAIGHAVAGNHQPRIFAMDVIPYINPANGSTGLALAKQW
jgi:membrane-associated phospholipid phosphatase